MGLVPVSPVGRLNAQKRSSHSDERKSKWLSSHPTFSPSALATSPVNPQVRAEGARETDGLIPGEEVTFPAQSHPLLLKLFLLTTRMTQKYLHKFCQLGKMQQRKVYPDFLGTNFKLCFFQTSDDLTKPLDTVQESVDAALRPCLLPDKIQVHCLKLCPVKEFGFPSVLFSSSIN